MNPSNGLFWATVVLAVATSVLAGSTIWYAISTSKRRKAIEKQEEVTIQASLMLAHGLISSSRTDPNAKRDTQAQMELVKGMLPDVSDDQ